MAQRRRPSSLARVLALSVCLAGPAGCHNAGDLVEASAAEQVRALNQLTWERLAERGYEFAQVGDLTRAEQYLYAALQRGGPPERILPRLLRVCIQAQRFRAAVQYAQPWLERHRDAWTLRYLVATVHVALNEPRLALEDLRAVVQVNPQHAESHFLMGVLLRDDVRDLGAADEEFRRYLALAPQGEHAEEARAGLLRRVIQGEP